MNRNKNPIGYTRARLNSDILESKRFLDLGDLMSSPGDFQRIHDENVWLLRENSYQALCCTPPTEHVVVWCRLHVVAVVAALCGIRRSKFATVAIPSCFRVDGSNSSNSSGSSFGG
jgi:hypothetical protein